MELIKNSENFKFVDTTNDGWKVNGSVNHELNGTVSININVSSDTDYIGDFYYNKPVEGNVSVNYNISEANRETFVHYSDTVIDFVLTQF